MIFDPKSILQSIFGHRLSGAAEVASRWRRAFDRDPALATDVIRLGGVMACQPVQMVNGWPEPAPIDPQRLAYEAGRRDFALLLLAQGGISHDELNEIIKESSYED